MGLAIGLVLCEWIEECLFHRFNSPKWGWLMSSREGTKEANLIHNQWILPMWSIRNFVYYPNPLQKTKNIVHCRVWKRWRFHQCLLFSLPSLKTVISYACNLTLSSRIIQSNQTKKTTIFMPNPIQSLLLP